MFKLHKKAAKSGDKVDFKLTHFKAIQVPKGWDKLGVSLICGVTGKTCAKLSRASVRNGTCQWTDSLTESMCVSQDEECLFKLVVSMVSLRSGILGEASVNMIDYMSSSDIVPVSLPLNKCNHGTVLQVKIQCLTPRSKPRGNELNDTKEDRNAGSQDMEVKSEGSDSIYARSTGSSSSKELEPEPHQGHPGNMEVNLSASGSRRSIKGSIESYYQDDGPPRSNSLSSNSQTGVSDTHSLSDYRNTLSSRISDSSRNLLDAAEDTIDQLRAESKMWERNSRKIMIDLETLQKEFSDLSKKQANSEIKLSAAWAERDMFKKEVAELILLLAKRKATVEPIFQDKDAAYQKELEDEIKFQRESNTNLASQLERSQEANIELISVLRELEETIEKQKKEMEHLYEIQSRFKETENSLQVKIEENQKSKLQQQQALEHGNDYAKDEQSMKNKNIFDIEIKYKTNLSAKEKEIVSLKAKLSESFSERRVLEAALNGDHSHLIEEIECLKEKLIELERDCDELTDENLSLLLKLKETTNGCLSEDIDHEIAMLNLEEKLKKKFLQEAGIETLKFELEDKVKELAARTAEVTRLGATLLSKEDDVSNLRRSQSELEAKVSDLERKNIQLEEEIQLAKRETEISTNCLNDMRNEMSILSRDLSSHVSVNRSLQKKSSDLENRKQELLLRLSDLEKENRQFSVSIARLEAHIKEVTDENESSKLELTNSRCLASNLQDVLTRLRNKTETQIVNFNPEEEDMRDRQIAIQAECEHLRMENAKLQILVDECDSVKKSNVEMKDQISESREYCIQLESRLGESDTNLCEHSQRVEKIEENISSMLNEFNSKENDLSSEIDLLLCENRSLLQEQNEVSQMYLEKATEVESLNIDIDNLKKQLSVVNDERYKIASDAWKELSGLLEDKAKLESYLQEVDSELEQSENKLNTLQMESEKKIQDLTDVISELKLNHETLMADHEKVLENWKSREEEFQTKSNDLELKLKACEVEHQQLKDQSTRLKSKLLNAEDELLSVKNEKVNLEASLEILTTECKNLEAQKLLFEEKNYNLEKIVLELEECKHYSVSLEEKLQQIEGDRLEKEALYVELGNELGRIKEEHRQIKSQVQLLEEQKNESQRKAQALEAELKSRNAKIQHDQKESGGHMNRRQGSDRQAHSKIESLENELAKAMEANKKHKVQLKRFLTEGRNGIKNSPKNPKVDEGVATKEKHECSQESELKDLQERYLSMSLRYAEVEAEREELVMKLRNSKDGHGMKWLN
ncbi:hypothetical protein ACFE04_000276 [Oxalis oulophora]